MNKRKTLIFEILTLKYILNSIKAGNLKNNLEDYGHEEYRNNSKLEKDLNNAISKLEKIVEMY